MNNFTVAILKTLLASASVLTAFSSAFAITLMFNISIQNGMPVFENIKFTIALFFATLFMLIICTCIKFLLSIAVDSRDSFKANEQKKIKSRVEDITL